MKARFVVFALVVLSLLAVKRLAAAPLLFESFENYNRGALDANLAPGSGGVNNGPNGGANPWWGPEAPNLHVVGPEGGVTPHSGTNMVRGLAPVLPSGDFDEDFYNLAFRLNQSNIYSGNILLDWWFYDPIGATNADRFQDYVSLAYFDQILTNADYSSPDNPGNQLQALSLGAGDPAQGANTNFYQAEILGVVTNSYDGAGWFDTTTPRTNGWHHARITVSPMATNGMVNVAFYIDNMTNPTLTNSTVSAPGFNCIELTADNGDAADGTVSAYYDDFRFYSSPQIGNTLSVALAATNAIVTFPDLWYLQTTTNLASTNWLTLTNAVSPYTNSLTSAQQFYRLRAF
jgi:hypothetical protein